ncbi:hypothetical protein CYMTET_19770 [Cymbomonas tetramitiformis]|uniref:Uncharacterized protein n=1 Tax=Cymbomonas tetramitiformis TaxID=36881 RepID=A0AAE0L4J5_9CHLO|nr:hypothetical protein CYMTET_19770 [Cymbomonas tetramitiformis]
MGKGYLSACGMGGEQRGGGAEQAGRGAWSGQGGRRAAGEGGRSTEGARAGRAGARSRQGGARSAVGVENGGEELRKRRAGMQAAQECRAQQVGRQAQRAEQWRQGWLRSKWEAGHSAGGRRYATLYRTIAGRPHPAETISPHSRPRP